MLVKYPYVEPELTAGAHRHPKKAAAKAEDLQRAFAVCCIRCPCPYLMPGLYSTVYRATFPAFLCGCLLFVSTVCVFYFFLSIATTSSAGYFLMFLFCLLSLLISKRFSGLNWFDSVYLVSMAGFVADQSM